MAARRSESARDGSARPALDALPGVLGDPFDPVGPLRSTSP
jgi:hypothetical protein